MKSVEQLIAAMREHKQHFADVLFWLERTERFRPQDLQVCGELLATLENEIRGIRKIARDCRVAPDTSHKVLRVAA